MDEQDRDDNDMTWTFPHNAPQTIVPPFPLLYPYNFGLHGAPQGPSFMDLTAAPNIGLNAQWDASATDPGHVFHSQEENIIAPTPHPDVPQCYVGDNTMDTVRPSWTDVSEAPPHRGYATGHLYNDTFAMHDPNPFLNPSSSRGATVHPLAAVYSDPHSLLSPADPSVHHDAAFAPPPESSPSPAGASHDPSRRKSQFVL